MGASLSGDARWDDAFAGGIAAACEHYGLALIGGDTIALPEERAQGVRHDRDRPGRRAHAVARRRAGRRPAVGRRG